MSGSSRHVRGRPEGDDTYLGTYEQSLTAFMFMSVPIPIPIPIPARGRRCRRRLCTLVSHWYEGKQVCIVFDYSTYMPGLIVS